MEGTANNNVENANDYIEDTQQPNPLPELSPEELLAKITEIVDNLFEPNNIVNNSYFLNRALNENFEIPVQVLYNERNVRNETLDSTIVNTALENSRNVIVNKNGDAIVSVLPKYNEAKRKITIKNIPKEKKDEFKSFVYSLEETKDRPCYWSFNPKLSIVSLTCKEEGFAATLYDVLTNIKFNEESLECSLDNDNLYISGLEIMKKKARNHNNPMNQMNAMNAMMMNPMYGYGGYNPYQMYPMYAPANNYYVTNHYQNMNYYYPNMQNAPYVKPMFNPNMNMNQATGQNPNMNSNPGMNKKPYNPNYRNDKKPYVKNKKPYNKDKPYNNKYNNRASTKSNSIEVNDNEFPPL